MSTAPDIASRLNSSPLHPLRIKQVLNLLGHEDVLQREVLVVNATYRETLAAALQFVLRGQLAVGLTGETIDAGQAAVKLLATLSKLTGRQ